MKKTITVHFVCLAMLAATALMSTGCATTGGLDLFKGLGGANCAGGT